MGKSKTKAIPYWRLAETEDPETGEEIVEIVETGEYITGWEGNTFIELHIPNKQSRKTVPYL